MIYALKPRPTYLDAGDLALARGSPVLVVPLPVNAADHSSSGEDASSRDPFTLATRVAEFPG